MAVDPLALERSDLKFPVEVASNPNQSLDGGARRERSFERSSERRRAELSEGKQVRDRGARDAEALRGRHHARPFARDGPQSRVRDADGVYDRWVGCWCTDARLASEQVLAVRSDQQASAVELLDLDGEREHDRARAFLDRGHEDACVGSLGGCARWNKLALLQPSSIEFDREPIGPDHDAADDLADDRVALRWVVKGRSKAL